MRRILIIAYNFWPENFPINNFVYNLALKTTNLTILTGKPNYPLGKIFKGYNRYSLDKEKFFKFKNVSIFRVPIVTRGNASKTRRILSYISFIISAVIFGFFLLRKKNFDHIMVYSPSPIIHCFVGIFFKQVKNSKLSIWLQDLWPQTLKLVLNVKNKFIYNFLDQIINYIYKSSNYIFIQSNEYRKVLRKVVRNEKLFYLPNSRNLITKKFEKKLSKNFNKKNFNICYFGNFGVVQEFNTILKVAKKLKKNKKINFHFFGEGVKKNNIQKLIKDKKLDNFFLHKGEEEKYLDHFIKQSSLLFLSLKKDKFLNLTSPSKLQLYLASGKPILGEISGESKKIISLSKSGFCVNHGDSKNLLKKINYFFKIRNNKTKINSYRFNSIRFYEKNFSINKITSKFIKIIE